MEKSFITQTRTALLNTNMCSDRDYFEYKQIVMDENESMRRFMCAPIKCALVEKISPMIKRALYMGKNSLNSWESLILFVNTKNYDIRSELYAISI